MEAGTAPTGQELEDELAELLDQETFDPPAEFVENALLSDPAIYEEAAKDPVAWWEKQAEDLHWFEKWDTALDESNPPYYKWFQGGKINAAYNCLDRHVEDGKGDKVAFHWRGEEGEQRDVTYADLLAETKQLANALVDNGVEKGDVVGIFLPMIPEVVVAMLACARIGAIHNVVFGGFSPNSVAERMEVSEAKLLITADGARRKGKTAEVKSEVDDVLGDMPTVKTVIVVKSVDNDAPMEDGRDLWWHDVARGGRRRARGGAPGRRAPAVHPLLVGVDGGAQGHPAHHRRLPDRHRLDAQVRVRPQARRGRVLVRGRRRLGHRPLLHRLRAAAQRGHLGHVRGPARLPGQGRALGHRREARRDHLLLRAHGHPLVHEVGRRAPQRARPDVAAPAGHGRRAHQPQGVAVVLARDRRRPLPGRRHLVADRDRAHPDLAAARASPPPSRARPPSRCPASRPRWWGSPTARRSARARGC